MLKPIDIHNKEFNRSFRGYNEDEIDEFLDEVVDDYETLYKENEELKLKLENDRLELEKLRKLEGSLQETLLLARTTADDIIKKANEDSKALMLKAENDSQDIRSRAETYASDLRDTMQREIKDQKTALGSVFQEKSLIYEELLTKQRDFVEKMKSLFQTELNLLNSDGVNRLFNNTAVSDIFAKEIASFATSKEDISEAREPKDTLTEDASATKESDELKETTVQEETDVTEDTIIMPPIGTQK